MEKKTRSSVENFLAAEVVGSNEDLLLQILLHVPVRPLIRFKVVSKQWKSIISNPEFARNHTRNSSLRASTRSPSGLFAYVDSPQFHFFSLSANDHSISSTPLSKLIKLATALECTLKVIQSCSGLLLCNLSFMVNRSGLEFHLVFNPVTHECVIVPPPDLDKKYKFRCFHLVFDPLQSPRFRVVCLKFSALYSSSGQEVLMFSPECRSWRSCCHFRSIVSDIRDSGVLWNGGIYWTVDDHGFLCFDMDSESIRYLPLPPKPRNYSYDPKGMYFGEWGGHFHSVLIRDQYTLRFIVRELDKDTLKWIVKYRVNLSRIISAYPEIAQKKSIRGGNDEEIRYTFYVLAVVRGDKEEEAELVLAIPGKVISYNLYSKLVRDLGEFANPSLEVSRNSRREFVKVHQYIETLSPLKEYKVSYMDNAAQ